MKGISRKEGKGFPPKTEMPALAASLGPPQEEVGHQQTLPGAFFKFGNTGHWMKTALHLRTLPQGGQVGQWKVLSALPR